MIWEGPDIDDTHIVFSITKSITSTVLGLLVDDGKAMLDTLAMEHLPALAADYPNVTLRHLITMTSGYRSVGEFGAWHLSHTPFTPDTPYFTPPGSQSFYYNSATDLLSGVLTQIAQEPIADLFRRPVQDPRPLVVPRKRGQGDSTIGPPASFACFSWARWLGWWAFWVEAFLTKGARHVMVADIGVLEAGTLIDCA
jgi:CubicO group peptidase (beta-lactamase class C family)